MKFKAAPLLMLLFALISSCDITKALSAQYAKEYCSCRFVLKQDDEYCAKAVEQALSVSDYKVDLEEKSVWARGLAQESKAFYRGVKSGCLLTE